MSHYPSTNANPNFSEMEKNRIKYWQENNLFQESIDNRKGAKDFIFYDGPPFANGLPHYGHLLTGYVKDAIARDKTVNGQRVERRFGWDCHGLPAEMGAEKELKISGRMQIMEFGIDKFNDHCRTSVMQFTSEWEKYVTRQGRWVDFENSYKTMDINFMESVLWAFKELYKKGLIYQSMRVMPYSWACETPLSNFETRMDNSYRERADKAVTLSFVLKEKPKFIEGNYSSYKIMAWTTTPWTLPSNLALAAGKDIEYSIVLKNNEIYIIASSSIKHYENELKGTESVQILKTVTGIELENLEYHPVFNYFKDHKNSFKVLLGDFVTEGDGTGIVHLAPGFGEDDQLLCQANNIELVCPVDNAGKFTSQVPDYQGTLVLDTNDEIIKYLKQNNLWVKTEQYLHNYPHCWRTDTPLIYKAVPSWYVEVTKFRDRMVANNKQINWIPENVKDGLFGKWLENARDWSISRNRFWGTPIPVWQSDDPKYPRIDVYGSIAELEKDFGVKVTDLHRPFIDSLTRPNPNDPTGKSMMRRVEDVFDCWFESGSMPYAQAHYPFENKDLFEKNFPADFIVEYVAQTRGWFYTLMVLSTALFDRPPFLNCICHGVILDEKGQKLSKRLQNYADPLELFETYSSDALRFLMLSSPVMRGQELLIDKEGKMVRDTLRLSIKPIWNAYNFFTLYANSDDITAKEISKSDNLLDSYILAKLKYTVSSFRNFMDKYDTVSACNIVDNFFEILNNWYIRRSRARFWRSEKDADKQAAYDTLYTVLVSMSKAISPILPFLTDEIYTGLVKDGKKSVHLCDFPDLSKIDDNIKLISEMDRVRDICSAALSIRNEENIRTRQPLETLKVIGQNVTHLTSYAEMIQDEVNVKYVTFQSDIGELATLRLQINFPVLGKRIPSKIKQIIAAVKENKWHNLNGHKVQILDEVLNEDEYQLKLEPKEKRGRESLPTNDALVLLDLNISEELMQEGWVRDIVRVLQQARKDHGLDVADKIEISISADAKLLKAITLFEDYLYTQVLGAKSDKEVNASNFAYITDAEIEGFNLKLGFNKI